MLGNNSINKFVYATTKELKGIVVKKQNTEIKILENISIPLDEGVFINGKVTKKDEFINSLELLKVSSQSFQNNIIFILDNSSIIFKKVEIPSKFNSKDLNNLAQLEFADLQDNNAREMIYSTSVVNSQHGKFGLCTAVERNLILEIKECFETANIKLSKIELLPLIIINYFQNSDFFDQKNFLLSILEDNFVTSFIFKNGDFSFVSRVRLLSEKGDYNFITDLYQSLSSLLNFYNSEHEESIEIYYYGIDNNEYEALHSMLDTSIPFNILALNMSLVDENLDKASIPCATLLYEHYPNPSLLALSENKEDAKRKKMRHQILLLTGLVGVLAGVCVYGGMSAYNRTITKQIDAIKNEIESEEYLNEYNNAFIYQNTNTNLLSRRNNFSSFEETCNAANTNIETYNQIALVMLNNKATIDSIACSGDTFTLSGISEKEDAAIDIADDFNELGLFATIDYQKRVFNGDKTTFAITLVEDTITDTEVEANE